MPNDPNKGDEFEDFFRRRFSDSERKSPSEGLWEKIENDLPPERNKPYWLSLFFFLLTVSSSVYLFRGDVKNAYLNAKFPSNYQDFYSVNLGAERLLPLDNLPIDREGLRFLQSTSSDQTALDKEYDGALEQVKSGLVSNAPNNQQSSISSNQLAFIQREEDNGAQFPPPTLSAFSPMEARLQEQQFGLLAPKPYEVAEESLEEQAMFFRKPFFQLEAGLGVTSLKIQPSREDEYELQNIAAVNGGFGNRLSFQLGVGYVVPVNNRMNFLTDAGLTTFRSNYAYTMVMAEQGETAITGDMGGDVFRGEAKMKSEEITYNSSSFYGRMGLGISYRLDRKNQIRAFALTGVQTQLYKREVTQSDVKGKTVAQSDVSDFPLRADLYLKAGMQFKQQLAQHLQVDISPYVQFYPTTSFSANSQFGFRSTVPGISLYFSKPVTN